MAGKPRRPSAAEKAQLADTVRSETIVHTAAEQMVDGATIAVFEDYVSDSPGYAGKVMMVIWPAGPQLYEVFIWRNGRPVHVDQDPSLRQDERRQVG